MTEIETALANAPGDGAAREREARLMAMLVRVAAGLSALERSGGAGGASGEAGASPAGAGDGASAAERAAGMEGAGDAADAGLPDDIDSFRRELEGRIAALRGGRIADRLSE